MPEKHIVEKPHIPAVKKNSLPDSPIFRFLKSIKPLEGIRKIDLRRLNLTRPLPEFLNRAVIILMRFYGF